MKKNILFILPFCPWPLKSGGHQAIFNGLLAVKDYANIYITYEKGEKELHKEFHLKLTEIFKNNITIQPYTRKRHNGLRYFIERVINKIYRKIHIKNKDEITTDFISTVYHTNNYYEHVLEIIKKYSIDIVQIEMIDNIDFINIIPPHIQTIFVHHELRYIRNELFLSQQNDSLYSKVVYETEKIKEIHLLNKFDKIITLSNIDKEKLTTNGVKSIIYPSFAVIKANSISYNININNNKLLSFVGPENHTPNRIGLKWFLDNCWNKLLEYDQEYRLQIIGIWTESTKNLWSKKYKNIEFLGFVDVLFERIKDSIMIVPITIGSGIRMKILEAMSNGIPFVSTTIGAEGIPVKNGINCYIADSPTDFIDKIIQLENLELKNKFIKSAHELVRNCYSIEKLKENRINIYESKLN